jgi:hypothetical protein
MDRTAENTAATIREHSTRVHALPGGGNACVRCSDIGRKNNSGQPRKAAAGGLLCRECFDSLPMCACGKHRVAYVPRMLASLVTVRSPHPVPLPPSPLRTCLSCHFA